MKACSRPVSGTPAGVRGSFVLGSGGRPLLPRPTTAYSLATLRVGTAWPMLGRVQSGGLADSSRRSKGAQGAATSGNDCVGGMHPEGRARSSDALATIAASSPDADISGTPAGVRGSFVLGSGGRRGLRGWRPPEANRHNAPRMGCQKTQHIITYGQHILQPSLPHRL